MKSLRIYLIVAGLLLTIYIIAQVNRPKAVDWKITLNSKEKTPYGDYILYNRLGDLFLMLLPKIRSDKHLIL
jgi:hypothetical protein